MITHDIAQGSPEWIAHRRNFNNASDAPAMMGVSPYKTRNELLHERYTGLTAEIDAITQDRFNDGHRFEALYRPLAEKIIGKMLYPITGTLGAEGSSFDGLTMCESIAFEHKMLSDRIRVATCAADLPIDLRIQMEQQLHVCAGDRVLFGASHWDANDNLVEDVTHWYEPDLELRASILAGWRQFEVDMAAYVPPEVVEMPAAVPIVDLPVVTVQVRGELTLCNLSDVTPFFDRFLSEAKTELETDEDFATAEVQAKKGREVAKRCKLTAKAVVDQMMSVADVTRTLEDYAAKFDALALKQEKAVKEQKDTRKVNARIERERAYAEHIAGLNAEIQPLCLILSEADKPNFSEAMKNQRLLSSLYNKLDTELARAKIAANTVATSMRAKIAWHKEHAAEYGFLFNDLQQIVGKAMDDFQLVVATRIESHKKAEAEKASALRAKIAEEERVKAEAAAAETARAQQAEIARLAEEHEAAERLRVAADTKRQLEEQAARIAAERKAAAVELKEAQANPDGAELSPAAQVLNEAESAQRFVTRHRTLAPVAAPTSPPTLRLGQINERIAPMSISADGLRTLGFEPAGRDKAAVLYHESQFSQICIALVAHIESVLLKQAA